MATAFKTYNVSPNPSESHSSAAVPIGSMMLWPTATAPAEWLICDGSAVSRNLYAALFSVIGSTYGVGDGSTTFNIPNLAGRVVRGVNGTYTLAATGGADAVNLIATDLPYHGHNVTDPGHFHTYNYGGNINVISSGGTGVAGSTPNISYNTGTASTGITIPAFLRDGSDNPIMPGDRTEVNIVNPYLAVNYIIKAH